MRKIFILLLTVCLFATCIPVMAAESLVNGSFAKGLDAWKANGEGITAENGGFDGDGCVKLVSKTPVYLTQTATELTGEKQYTLSLYTKAAADEKMAVKLEFWNNTSYMGDETHEIAPTADWTNTKINFAIPKEAAEVKILLRLLDKGGECYYDKVSLRPYGEEEPLPEPESDENYVATDEAEKAARLLQSLELLEGKEDGNLALADYLSRAEATTMIMRLTGVADAVADAKVNEQKFSDVDSSHWAFATINAAENMGIIDGYTDGTFRPEQNVTDTQFAKMLVTALGYRVKAESEGGYPSGYISIANKTDLLKGVDLKNTYLPRGGMVLMVANALTVPIFEKLSYGTEDSEYKESVDKTLLSVYLDVEHIEGQISANYQLSIDSVYTMRDEVTIKDKTFKKGQTDADTLFGFEVDAYAKENEAGEKVLLYAEAKKDAFSITLSGNDITEIADKKIVYEENGSKKTIRIADGAVKYLNFDRVASLNSTDIKNDNATVTCIIKNNECTVLLASMYKDYIADKVNAKDKKVILKEGSPLIIDLEDDSISQSLTDNTGESKNLSDIGEYTVLSVVSNAAGTIRHIYLSKDKINGEISEKTDKEVKIGEEFYKWDSSLANSLQVGQNGNYYLDAFGKIAAFHGSATNEKYAYLVELGKNGDGLSYEAEALLFTDDGASGKMQVFKLAEKLRVNDKLYTKEEILDTQNVNLYSNGKTKQQLVTYKINTEGEISNLTLAKSNINPVGETENSDEAEFSLDARPSALSLYNEGSRLLNGTWYYHPQDTRTFLVPETYNTDEENFTVTSAFMTSWNNTVGVSGIELYDIEGVVPAVILQKVPIGTAVYDDFGGRYRAIVTDIREGLDKEGSPAIIVDFAVGAKDLKSYTAYFEKDFEVFIQNPKKPDLKGHAAGLMSSSPAEDTALAINNGTTWQWKDKVSVSALKKGDILQVQFDATMTEIKNAKIVLRANTPRYGEFGTSANHNQFTSLENQKDNYRACMYAFVQVSEVTADGFIAEIEKSNGTTYKRLFRYYLDDDSCLCGTFDMETETYTGAASRDFSYIEEGDLVFVAFQSLKLLTMVAFKNIN